MPNANSIKRGWSTMAWSSRKIEYPQILTKYRPLRWNATERNSFLCTVRYSSRLMSASKYQRAVCKLGELIKGKFEWRKIRRTKEHVQQWHRSSLLGPWGQARRPTTPMTTIQRMLSSFFSPVSRLRTLSSRRSYFVVLTSGNFPLSIIANRISVSKQTFSFDLNESSVSSFPCLIHQNGLQPVFRFLKFVFEPVEVRSYASKLFKDIKSGFADRVQE